MKLKWLTPGRLEQLALGLEVEEAAPGSQEAGWVDPLEAKLRSELARKALENRQKEIAAKTENPEEARAVVASDWTEEYLRLRDNGWPWRVAAYIAWAASPKRDRWPESVEKLAIEVLGLTGPRTIYTWRKKNKSIDEVVSLMQAAPLLEHRRDVIQALIMAASDPDHRSNPDRKLLLEMTGDYVPRQRNEEGKSGDPVRDLSEISEEELDMMSPGSLEIDDGQQTADDGEDGE
jgi:hypothetical protein